MLPRAEWGRNLEGSVAKLLSAFILLVLLFAFLRWAIEPIWAYVLVIGVPVSVYSGVLGSIHREEREGMALSRIVFVSDAAITAVLALFLLTVLAVLLRIVCWAISG